MESTVEAVNHVLATYGKHQESLLKIYDDTVNFISEQLRKSLIVFCLFSFDTIYFLLLYNLLSIDI